MNVLSLFDGISCGRLALQRAGIRVDNYIASEIKKKAVECSKDNWNDIIHVGDVNKLSYRGGGLYYDNNLIFYGIIDILIGGSPCQDFSIMGYTSKKELYNSGAYGLNGNKSKLFFQYLRLLQECNPNYFLLENVKMKKDSKHQLDEYLGVSGIMINSSLVSYQNRARYYWTNIKNVKLPEDKHVSFQNFKSTDIKDCIKYKLNHGKTNDHMWNNGAGKNNIKSGCTNVTHKDKINCLTRKQSRCPNSGLVECEDFCRLLTREEIEQAQTLPVGYTKCLAYTNVQDVCGDGWTVDVVSHIFGFLPNKYKEK